MREMDAEQTLKNAAHHGVTLRVPPDRDVIQASPQKSVTPELAANIKRGWR